MSEKREQLTSVGTGAQTAAPKYRVKLVTDSNHHESYELHNAAGMVARGMNRLGSQDVCNYCNAHDDLVAALRETLAELEAYEAPRDPLDSHNVRVEQARAALAKVSP